jgi:diadenosine tetraphosphatase ApaH/serine/threonine PP2A family protein phosphatase
VAYPLTAILSDLHGNAPALETALADARERGARRYVCLGDVIGYGARPRHNLDWVMRLCTGAPEGPEEFGALEPGLCLQGNHEFALLNSAEDFNARARAAIEWTREELNRDEGGDKERRYAYWDFLAGLEPVAHDGTAMFAHGSPRDPVREYMLPRDITDDAKMRANWQCMEEPVCFVGHSHVPAVYFEDRRLFRPRGTEGPYELGTSRALRAIVNVGSIGQPRDGDKRLSYVLYDGRAITFVRLDYDVERAVADIKAVPALPEYLAERLKVGR